MPATLDPRAGTFPTPDMLENVPRLMTDYYARQPDATVANQRVSFGTSGHRGSSLDTAFNEDHIIVIAQAVCDYRVAQQITGPLYLGADTHALSSAAWVSALEVLAANGVTVMIDHDGEYTPTPAVSHAIINYNRTRTDGFADGIVITPSHNPPRYGGFKYNPPGGGGADTRATDWIQNRANDLLAAGARRVKRVTLDRALKAGTTHTFDFLGAYVGELGAAIDMDALRGAGLKLGVDPLGGAGVHYWGRIAEQYRVPITVVSNEVDPTFRFVSVDADGQIRMDCSSPYAVKRLVGLKDQFDVAWACDTDHDRHGIVTRAAGLLPSNHFLAAATNYVFAHRPGWPAGLGVGTTVVTTSMIERVAARLKRPVISTPVGFKWFVDGLQHGRLAFCVEESAGGLLVRRDGSLWTTDKDGIVIGLLAAEMTAVMSRDPGELYRDLEKEFGELAYDRIDAPATPEQKAVLKRMSPDQIKDKSVAGDRITDVLTNAPGNGEPIGGLKVVTEHGWFAARPSGTEPIYKLYAESTKGPDHLRKMLDEAQALVRRALSGAK